MGRTISAEHRGALIAYWAERLRDCEPTGPALRRLLRPDQAGQSPADANTVRQCARAAAALRAEKGDAARQGWIGRFLVDRGPDLLIDDGRRRAALATVRDRARRDRRRAAERHVVQMVLGAADLRRLRSFAEVARCASLSEAIVRLIRDAAGVPRRNRKGPPASSTADLFAMPQSDGAAESTATRGRGPRHKP